MNINRIFDYLTLFSKKKYVCLANNMMKSSKVTDFINDFISDPSPLSVDLDRVKLLIELAKSSYDLDEHVLAIDDTVYDVLLSKYKKFRNEPFASSTMNGLSTNEYKYPSLAGTLDKAHYIYESEVTDDRLSVEEWISKHSRYFKNGLTIMISYKIDGTSIASDIVSDGERPYILSSLSRGKLDYGEGGDVSQITNGLTFIDVEDSRFHELGIQYEFAMSTSSKEKFEKLMNRTFANHRSATTALMRRMLFADKDQLKKYRKLFSLVPVGFELPNSEHWLTDFMYIIEHMGYGDVDLEYRYDIFYTMHDFMLFFEDYSNFVSNLRDELDYAIDGLVITICDKEIQEEIGRSGNINKYQLAYKFPEKRKKTKVMGLQVTTGNFGYKELMVDVIPVTLNGTKQGKGQVHSLNKFSNFDLSIGDECYLKLSGDVIPYLEIDDTCKKGNGYKLELPTTCDCCEEKLVIQKDKLRCVNQACDYNQIGKLVTFVKEMNSKGIGPETIKQAYYTLGIRTIPELLDLTYSDFMLLDGFQDESSANAAKTLEDLKNKPRKLAVVISGLGIDDLRTSTAEKILDVISYSELLYLIDNGDVFELEQRLRTCKGVDKKAEGYARELISIGSKYIEKVVSYMNIKTEKTVDYDKAVLISGFRGDDFFEMVANSAGYNVRTSGTKYDILVIADNSGRSSSKAKLAEQLGRPILTKDEFFKQNGY